MSGMRFGVGIAAGLLLGLAIITASAGVTLGPFASLSPAAPTQGTSFGAVTTYTSTAAGTSTTTAVQSSSTGAPPALVTSPTNSSLSSAVSSTTNPTDQKATNAGTFGSAPSANSYSSKLSNLAQQPMLSDAIVFLPVLVAFIVGAILYRASSRNREPAEGQQ